MKRLIALIAVLLMLAVPALAEPEELAAVFAAEHLPEYTFIDGAQFDETAMLLVEDAGGQVYFAGCVRDGDEWTVTLSTPFPDWMNVALDTYHAGDGSMRLWTDRIPEMREYEDELLDIYIDLRSDGVWHVYGVNNGWEVIEFRRQSIYEVCGYEYFCDVDIPLDITQIDWGMLPRSFQQAMDLFETSRWRLIAKDHTPVYTADGSIGWHGASGAAERVIFAKDGMAEVRFLGREDTGWIAESSLIPGSEQAARYDIWCENGHMYGVRDIILEADDSPITWYAVAHDDSTASPFVVEHVESVSLQGWCADGCCALLYSETPDSSAFVPMSQLPYTIE